MFKLQSATSITDVNQTSPLSLCRIPAPNTPILTPPTPKTNLYKMAPKGRQSQRPGYGRALLTELTSPENRSVVTAVTMFAVSSPNTHHSFHLSHMFYTSIATLFAIIPPSFLFLFLFLHLSACLRNHQPLQHDLPANLGLFSPIRPVSLSFTAAGARSCCLRKYPRLFFPSFSCFSRLLRLLTRLVVSKLSSHCNPIDTGCLRIQTDRPTGRLYI